jgi:hypothetical protein
MAQPHARDFEVTKRRPEVLDGDMSASDILGVLEELEFASPSALRAVRLDRDARDFICRALRQRAAAG